MNKNIIIIEVTPDDCGVVDNNIHYRAVIKPHNPVTTCEIQGQSAPIMDNFWGLCAYGIGVCKRGDVYDRKTGCRMALASALRKIGDDQVRAAFWKKYLERFPIKDRTDPNQLEFLRFINSLRHLAEIMTRRGYSNDLPTFKNKPPVLRH